MVRGVVSGEWHGLKSQESRGKNQARELKAQARVQ